MKQEIINRIKQLGGNIANVKGMSLQDDLCAITFNTALYQKPEDTPWLSAEDTEPIMGLGNWVDENMELFNSDKEAFYKKMVDTYYTLNEEPRGQFFLGSKTIYSISKRHERF
ncbi:hypothetical protein NXV74_25990 [Bacteroides thetaiotaomicron]|uniref:hypothetical protein n=1 Tax=Bacteroides thetaiotaomicron TaxID=818 RepID=UPI00216573D5|nr:hypothetical protein [Bacteroides thetaiotaomicron]MCS2360187.1 hypothetical protein [Bacteroides thetaiotaomicron]MCS3265121.1 hypothetical protein [Bacteroides thetaiotaomicron]